jgi:Family of unknown function (DUF5372)
MSLNDPGNAPIPTEQSRLIRVTHPFHPLSGKQFDLLEYRRLYSEGYVWFHDDGGQLRIIPAIWTDFVKTDVFVETAAGTSPLHAAYLLELVELVERARKNGQDV